MTYEGNTPLTTPTLVSGTDGSVPGTMTFGQASAGARPAAGLSVLAGGWLDYAIPEPYTGANFGAAATALREYWCLSRNHLNRAMTKARCTVTTGSAGTGVMAAYRCSATLGISTQIDRWTLDTTGTGDTDHTLTGSASIAPGEWVWLGMFSEVAATFRCLVNFTSYSHMGLNTSLQPIMTIFRGSIAVASSFPATAPALSAFSQGAYLSNIPVLALG